MFFIPISKSSLAKFNLGFICSAIDVAVLKLLGIFKFGKNAKSGAGYFVISNKNSDPVILKKVTADFGKAMLHKTDVDKKGVAKMKHLESVEVPGNGLLKLEPGGTHIMFMNISIEFDESRKYPVTLVFEEQGSLDIDLKLKSAKKSQKAHIHKNGHSHNHKHDH